MLESHTPGGGRPPAQVYQELSWFIKEELEGVFTIIEEVEQTISVCLKTQSTLLDLQVELEITAMCMELNMRTQYKVDHNFNVPCAVCYATTRAAAMMIPAKTTCPQSWTREYYGYLMSAYKGRSTHPHYRTMFECVDKDPDSIPGSAADTDGALFYHVEANCNGMPCPPYDPQKELNCVVCTK